MFNYLVELNNFYFKLVNFQFKTANMIYIFIRYFVLKNNCHLNKIQFKKSNYYYNPK